MTKLRIDTAVSKSHRLTAVAACEDAATETRVNNFCLSLSRHLGQSCALSQQVWLVSELRANQLRTLAAEEAADADLVMVAVHHAGTMPPEVAAWLDLWLQRKHSRPAVLIALFDPVYRGISSTIQTQLQEIARKAKAEFLVHTDDYEDES